MFAKSLAAAAVLGLASAQSGVEVIPVLVGMSANGTAGTIFSPEKVTAPIGSMVQFQFMGGNHTVTQSNFANPCTPLSTSNTSATGFHSDYIPAMSNQETGEVPTYTIMINDTAPIWAYCAQGQHCQNGMVMVINENAESENTLDAYKTSAASVEQATVPGANAGNGGGDGGAGGDGGGDQAGQDGQDGAGMSLRVPAALLAIAAGAAALF